MSPHHIILIVCISLIVLNVANMIRVAKKAYREGKEFDGRKLQLRIEGERMRKKIRL